LCKVAKTFLPHLRRAEKRGDRRKKEGTGEPPPGDRIPPSWVPVRVGRESGVRMASPVPTEKISEKKREGQKDWPGKGVPPRHNPPQEKKTDTHLPPEAT